MSLIVVSLLLITSSQAFADPLFNASKQRIGNYDVEMTTEPRNLLADNPTKIVLRIAGVNGDDLVDVPIQIRLLNDEGKVLQWTSPIIVPYGHYFYEYTFAEPGRYVIYVDLRDDSYSKQILTFTFLVNVGGPLDYLYTVIPATIGVSGSTAGALVFIKKKRNKRLYQQY